MPGAVADGEAAASGPARRCGDALREPWAADGAVEGAAAVDVAGGGEEVAVPIDAGEDEVDVAVVAWASARVAACRGDFGDALRQQEP